MIRNVIFLGALAAGFSAAAAAQVIVQPPQSTVVQNPQTYYQGQPLMAPAVMVQPVQPYYVTRVYVPQGIIQTTVAQPAPFNPAPRDTSIETTAGRQVVKSVNGFDVVFEDSAGQKTSHALLMGTLEEGSADMSGVVERLWPLTVGKSDRVNLSASTARTIAFSVLRTEIVAVPAGSFYTYVIERRDRWTADGSETVATSWYAPSIGTIVKFAAPVQRPGTKAQPSFELVTIRLPAAPVGTMLVPVARRADTAETQLQFCSERGTIVRVADGRVLYFDCASYVQADRMGYDQWLLVH